MDEKRTGETETQSQGQKVMALESNDGRGSRIDLKCRCGTAASFTGKNRNEARRAATKAGWGVNNEKCPACRLEEKA